jgi:putative phosphoribosyl transferase
MLFHDRAEAGRELAKELAAYAGKPEVVVLALPRGGVPVAYEVARALQAPLDVFVVRKLGLPGHPEYAIGAVATGGVRVLDEDMVRSLGIREDEIASLVAEERRELARREQAYRVTRDAEPLEARTVILVDDGLATGASMSAAVIALRRRSPARIVVAVPVGAAETCAALTRLVDEVVCARTPDPFQAVGLWYADFEQTSDAEVRELLARAARLHVSPTGD